MYGKWFERDNGGLPGALKPPVIAVVPVVTVIRAQKKRILTPFIKSKVELGTASLAMTRSQATSRANTEMTAVSSNPSRAEMDSQIITMELDGSVAGSGGSESGRQSRTHSLFSGQSEADTLRQLADIGVQQSRAKKMLSMARLGLVASPSLVVATVLTFLNISNVLRSHEEGAAMRHGIEVAESYNFLASRMAEERGLTCVTLSSLKSSDAEFEAPGSVKNKLADRRGAVDRAFNNLSTWFGDAANTAEFASKDVLRENIGGYRKAMDGKFRDIRQALARGNSTAADQTLELCQTNLNFYTAKINVLIKLGMVEFKRSERGRFWLSLHGYRAWLAYEDLERVQMISGENALLRKSFADNEHRWGFIERNGEAEVAEVFGMLEVMRRTAEEQGTRRDMLDLIKADSALLHSTVDELQHCILHMGVAGGKLPKTCRPRTAILWLLQLDHFIHLLKEVEASLWSLVESGVAGLVGGLWEASLTIVYAAVVICAVVPPLVAWYVWNSHRTNKRTHAFMLEQAEQAQKINSEKQKSEELLGQMLPKNIARVLRAGGEVPPEVYDSATLFFSDIYGFGQLSTFSSPVQISTLLNSLYTAWDEIVGQHDVYKVETVMDGYVVSSGVPKRNGDDHSFEICTMALDFLASMETFRVEHLPSMRLLIRIGCHTGRIAAGVVGNKMPRYCLFGDTINTCARVQTNSKALRIQLSRQCAEHLDEHHNGIFGTEYRGVLKVKGKGDMETFWLLGKRGHPYVADLEQAEEEVAKAAYWLEM